MTGPLFQSLLSKGAAFLALLIVTLEQPVFVVSFITNGHDSEEVSRSTTLLSRERSHAIRQNGNNQNHVRRLSTYVEAEGALEKQQKSLLNDPKSIQEKSAIEYSAELDGCHGRAGGIIVLGMHRSGTSMLTGLMSKGFGYDLGNSPLFKPVNGENSKGFFERIDIVRQNDIFMKHQNAMWKKGTLRYNVNSTTDATVIDESLHLLNEGGRNGLEFMTRNPSTLQTPWIQKDPRMCITLKNWIGLIRREQSSSDTSDVSQLPAILFTYRHPLEVARSLYRRENERNGDKSFTLAHGLRLWIIYNMRAIQNSYGLCMVHTSNDQILQHGKTELQRISDELSNKCHVIRPPMLYITQEVVDDFISPELQHTASTESNSNNNSMETCKQNIIWHDQLLLQDESPSTSNHAERRLVARETDRHYNNIRQRRHLDVVGPNNSSHLPYDEYEKDMYTKAMTIFCDMESGVAFEPSYASMWPEL